MELNVRNRGASSFTFGQRRLHRDRGHPSRNFQGGCFLDEIFPGPCWEVNAFFFSLSLQYVIVYLFFSLYLTVYIFEL